MMGTRALATPLLAVVTLFGLMVGTASAKVKIIDTTGVIDVPRVTSLLINSGPSPDTLTYRGVVDVGRPFPFIRINAAREIKRKFKGKRKKPGAAAVGAKKRKPKPKTVVQRPSTEQNRLAENQALDLCKAYTRTTFLEVYHLSTPPFLLGRVFPEPSITWQFVSDRPPPGDTVRAVQLSTSFGGAPVVTVGPFQWQVICEAIQTDVRVPAV
jgi:hypothetical protein